MILFIPKVKWIYLNFGEFFATNFHKLADVLSKQVSFQSRKNP